MSSALLPLWLAACAAAGALTIRALRAARAEPSALAPRSLVASIPLAAAIVIALAGAVLAVVPALEGDARLRNPEEVDDHAPARARLFLRQVRVEGAALRVGYSPEADVALPSLYRLEESVRAWDLLDVRRSGDELTLTARPRPEPTTTRLRFAAREPGAEAVSMSSLARQCANEGEAETVSGPVVAAALCEGAAPRAILAFEAHGEATLLSAAVWRRARLEPHHIEIEPEALIQIGAASAAVPGVTMWEVPAPARRSELFSAPAELLGGCDAFAGSVYSGLEAAADPSADGAVCVVPFAPPFALEVRRLRPDLGGVVARTIWSSTLFAIPLFAWAFLLLLRRPSQTTRADTADLLRFALLATAAAAVFAARLLWAHRIDMLRDWEPTGLRTIGNLVTIACAFAGFVLASALTIAREHPRRLLIGIVAFTMALAIAWLTAPSELGLPSTRSLAQVGLAAAFGSVALWRRSAATFIDGSPRLFALAIAGGALATSIVAPRAVALKLLFCTLGVFASYRVLRAGFENGSNAGLASAVVAIGAMIAGLAALDTGLTSVLTMPGLLIALAIAGHDALFGTQSLTEVKGYRLRQAPVVWLQGGLLAALVAFALVTATVGLVRGTSPTLARDLTLGAPHLLWIVALLFAAPALIAHRRGDTRTAGLFGAAAIAVIGAWVMREQLAEMVLSSSAPAAQRYAIIADPGYSLLADPRAFLAGITGWAETIIASASAARGAGYFGAQLIDPGVLLSVENDYLPILMLRELGVLGVTTWAIAITTLLACAWLAGRELTGVASSSARARLTLAAAIALLLVYQPLASLGALPLTGVSWIGLGIDSPSDFWLFIGILGYLVVAGESAREVSESQHEHALRRSRRFARSERWVFATASFAAIAAVLVIARAASFATSRPLPVADDGTASAPFIGLEAALDYARALRCSAGDDGVISVIGSPTDAGTARFDRRLAAAARGPLAVGDAVSYGLVTVSVEDAGSELKPTCEISLEHRVLAALRVKPNRPYQHARVRLVTEPMGRAAGDHGELVSGDIAIRLRATAPALALPRSAGIYAATSVDIGGGVVVSTSSSGEVRLELADKVDDQPWLFVAKRGDPAVGVHSTEERASWTPLRGTIRGEPLVLQRDALIVVGHGARRNVWLLRLGNLRAPSAEPSASVGVGSLLADDARTVGGARRRLYVYGNDLSELGWVNPFRVRGSVGLDGWVNAAIAEWNPDQPAKPVSCGLLSPPAPTLAEICAANPAENVIECRVSLQPELSIRLRHLTEMIAAAPNDFATRDAKGTWPAPLRASLALIRGDTGEIVAQGGFVPGRASSAYAPTSSALVTHLIRLREDRDPASGAKLPPASRGEASAEKVEHNRPIAIGSTLKPMMARAFEQTVPSLAPRLVLSGSPTAGAICPGGRTHAILGHCPPTDSLWNQQRALGLGGFLGRSANWYMAAISLLGTAFPDGEAGFGDGTAVSLDELLARNVGDHAPDWALWTRYGGKDVLGADGKLSVEGLRGTPLWRRFEAVIGRPLCEGGSKAGCAEKAQRADVCAARALPITGPSADLRQIVSIGPSSFDFYPRLANRERRVKKISTREFLQFLRGSGLHPIGSLLQLTDAFNRVVFAANHDPLRDGPYRLAATWFPGPIVGELPGRSCEVGGAGEVGRGLCEVIDTGTGRSGLRALLSDPRLEFYGAKTGTIDSLGDVAAKAKACERFRDAHTLGDRPRDAANQPYWLECGTAADTDDSLLVVSFAVKTVSGGRVPLTLGLAFQRGGSGLATRIAAHYIDIIADYFSAGEAGLP